MAPSIPAALERVVGKAMNKIREERFETRARCSRPCSVSAPPYRGVRHHRAAEPALDADPSAVLRLVTHAPIKWRAAALTALMVTALVLLYVSRSPSPYAAPFPDASSPARRWTSC